MKQLLIIVSAPSGAGKSTLCSRALKEFPDLVDSISYTTRHPRPNEKNGDPYFFVTTDEFKKKVSDQFFAEWAMVHGHYYGTSKDQLTQIWATNHYVIMDVDIQGARSLKSAFPLARSIFIQPPSIETLRERLQLRANGQSDDIELRMKNAQLEMAAAPEFDYIITNSEIQTAYQDFKKVIEEILNRE